MADAQVKASQIERNYDEKFATFLTSKQIFKMKEAEHKFRDTLSNMRKTKKHQKRKK